VDSKLLPIIEGEDKESPLLNRIRKNYRHVRKWAKRTKTDCFRIYDRDIKEYPVAIDYYAGKLCIHYFSYDREEEEPREDIKQEVDLALTTLFGQVPMYWRTRIRRKKLEQYEKIDRAKEFFTVREYGVQFRVNLQDYLDTGLFLDHRESRQWVASIAEGKRLLNLFAYTCSFSLHAAIAGACYTKSVDLSKTYTLWGRENFLLNAIPLENHDIVVADCMQFLDSEVRSRAKYDIIVIDPPTLSRSKKMDGFFDIQVEYVTLISKALLLLAEKGVIFFSTNARKFIFDTSLFAPYRVEEISERTLPLDFHNKKIHRSWKVFL
jgi:23S rRNA (cytosine1962-C5)-methyltransferase